MMFANDDNRGKNMYETVHDITVSVTCDTLEISRCELLNNTVGASQFPEVRAKKS